MSDADDFMAFTGCSTRVEAEGWLDMYSNHMTSAVEAYYAMNGSFLSNSLTHSLTHSLSSLVCRWQCKY
jgi:hypothetical protein